MIKISKRLCSVAENVKFGGTVADVGCDHGFTSIYLLQAGLADHVIAMDINEGPLERAEEHRKEYDMCQKMELRLSDGLEKLSPGETNAVLISGMGGELMARILYAGKDVVSECRELILSPQSEIKLVRRMLHVLNFKIDFEEMLLDQGKYYVIIHAVPGEERYDEIEDYVYGKYLIDHKDSVFQEYIEKELQRVEKICDALSEQEELNEKAREQFLLLMREQISLQEILLKMQRKE